MPVLEREEYIEQAYFFHTVRERLLDGLPAQDILALRTRLGDVDFADLIYVRSEHFVKERQRLNPEFTPKFPILFGEKEGKIARANRGRDPLYLFAALQRQLGYPEVPRPRRPDSLAARLEELKAKVRELETRLKVIDSEVRGQLDLKQLEQLGRPELLEE